MYGTVLDCTSSLAAAVYILDSAASTNPCLYPCTYNYALATMHS